MKEIFYYLNPNHLKGEITGWGYHYDVKKAVSTYGLFAAVSLVIAYFFNLDIIYGILMVLMGFFFLPAITANNYRKMYEQRRFDDVTTYLRQLLYSFEKNGKVLDSLKDVKDLFNDGPMRETIEKTIYYIENDSSAGEDPTGEGLKIIEEAYPTRRIRAAHKFLLNAESMGGNATNTVKILVEDVEQWQDRNDLLVQEIRTKKRTISSAIVVTFILMLGFVMSIRLFYPPLDYSKVGVVQVATVIAWFIDLWIYTAADRRCTIDFIKEEDVDEEEILRRYNTVVNWDEVAERRKAFTMAAVPAVIGIVLLIFKFKLFGFIALGVAVFLAASYKLGYNIAFKNTIKEIKIAFPQWLMTIALLQQTSNIQGSIYTSYPDAPAVLKPELKKMYKALEEDPNGLDPFINFMRDFDIKEITASMQMLYAVQSGTSGDTDDQIANILSRNNKMTDDAEKIQNEDRVAGVLALFFAPQVVCGAKLLIDMGAIMVIFFVQATSYL